MQALLKLWYKQLVCIYLSQPIMFRSLKFVIVQLSMLLMAFCCNGQSYYFKHYQADDGLAHNTILTIMQDSKGLIWIGSRGGLNRFDGYAFKTYKNAKNKFGNIGNNVVHAIAEDHAGMIWVGTGKGLYRYNPYLETFTSVEQVSQKMIGQLLVDAQNNLWFLANGFLHCYLQKTHKLISFNKKGACLALDEKKQIWMGDDDGIIQIINPVTFACKQIRIISTDVPSILRTILRIMPTGTDEVLIGCFKQGLKSYNIKSGAVKSLLSRNADNTEIYVRDIKSGNDGKYWVATETGIYIYDLAKHSSRNLRKRAGDAYSLSDNAVYTICRDHQGGMWAGTFFGGLNYYSKENARFEKYYPLPDVNSISGNAVREICADNKGNLWIGTEDAGINKFDVNSGRFTQYKYGTKNGVSYPNIHGLKAVGNQLFIGPFLHGLEIMDMQTGRVTDRFKLIGEQHADAKSEFILSIHLTKDSTILIGTVYNGSGLFSYNRQSKTFTRIKEIPYNSYVYDIQEDHEGNIWTGSISNGAYFYNPKTGKHGNFRFGDKVKGKLVNEFAVYGILEDSYHAMWFTTEGGGLIRLSPDRKSVRKFTTEDGLPSNVLFRMLEDDNKHLWVSSLKGLVYLDLQTFNFKVYTQSNGLITDQFNYNSAYKHTNGKMYFGSVKGMIAFNPVEFSQNEPGPATYITGFQISNKEIVPDTSDGPLRKSILYTDSITLKYNQSNINIEFAAINYSSPGVTRYRYQMKGLDKTWTYLNSNRKAYFTDLSPGNYTFIVQAESNVGSWRGQERKLYVKILPPFWKSVTAYIFYLLLMGASIYLAVGYYHRRLERRNLSRLQLFEHEKEKEIYQAKIEFFTNIAHEIQTPLTLIVGPVERLLKKAEQYHDMQKGLLMVEKNARRLNELTAQLLDFRKTEMDQFGLNFVNINIVQLLSDQIAVFKSVAEKQRINLTFNTPNQQLIAFVDREALVKICSNLISNAVKYAATKATVSLLHRHADDENFIIQFSNDGKGIPAEFSERIFDPFFRLSGTNKPGTGIGLSLAKSLTELHSGKLKLAHSNNSITVFELTLPIHQKFEFKLGSWKKLN